MQRAFYSLTSTQKNTLDLAFMQTENVQNFYDENLLTILKLHF